MRRSDQLRWAIGRCVGYSALALAMTMFVTSCSDDDTNGPGNSTAQLSQQLTDLLNTVGGTDGKSFFALPAENDLASIPQDPRNPLTPEKVALGKLLYHEPALMTNPKKDVGLKSGSCASCHHAAAGFQSGLAQGIGEGGWGYGTTGESRIPNPDYAETELDVQPIKSPTSMHSAWQQVMLWNGQFGAKGPNEGTESQWTPDTPKEVNTLGFEGVETQAIAGLDVHRFGIEKATEVDIPEYQQMFADAFPSVPANERMTTVNTGLAIAAYERSLLANKAPFQRWLNGDGNAMSEQELRGALVFFGTKAQCYSCHTGPALSSMTFYALGMKDLAGIGVYGDAPDDATKQGRGGFTGRAEDMYKFKTPQLYNLVDARFYGHGSSFSSLRSVVEYKNAGVAENADVPQAQLATEFAPLNLTESEMDDLTAFLATALHDPDLERYEPTTLPTGECFPNNDQQSRTDRGCN